MIKKKHIKNKQGFIQKETGISIVIMAVLLIGIFSVVFTQKNISDKSLAATKATNAYCSPATNPSVSINTTYDNAASSQLGPGWVGGDATYSTRLPNGQEAWAFSDTLIGTAASNGAATFTGMPHNTELVGTGAKLTTDYAGTYKSPQTLITDTNGNNYQWEVADTYIENGHQLIFVNEFGPVAGSSFDIYTGKSGIAMMSLTGKLPTPTSVVTLPTDSTTQWGNAVTSDSTYTYVYGNDTNTSNGAFYGMKIARVPLGQTTQTNKWQYWNGSNWVAGESKAIALSTGNEITGVTKQLSGNGYIGVSIQNSVYTDNKLYVSYSCSPQGPWNNPTAIYTIPEVTQYHDEIAYIPTIHPELSSNTAGLLVSYNIDSTDGLSALAANIHQYQPRFLNLK